MNTAGVAQAIVMVPLLAGALPTLCSAQQQQSVPAVPLVFDRVSVVDVETGQLRPAQRVVIRGNRIQAAGERGAVPLPKGAQVVDARGKYLIPGLWDMHVHADRSADIFYPLLLANGVTGIRNPGAATSLDTMIQWRREILAGARVGPPRQLLSGPVIQTYCSPDWSVNVCVALGDNPDSASLAVRVRSLVDSLRAAGADMLKLRDLYPATTYFRIAAAARRVGIPFGGHTWDPIDVAASDSGARIIDHLLPWYEVPSGLRVWCWTPKPTASVEKCRPVAERFRRNQTWGVPTVTVYIGSRKLSATRRSYTLAARLHDRATEFFAGALLHGNWLRDSVPASEAYDTQTVANQGKGGVLPDSLGVLRLMQRTGFPIAAGTDAGTPRLRTMPPGLSLHTELAIDVAEGLTPLTALQSATLNPAKLWHATDSMGTVAAGKLADLVLLDANPLDDITNTTTIRAVVANGRYFDRAALDELLIKVQARVPKEP